MLRISRNQASCSFLAVIGAAALFGLLSAGLLQADCPRDPDLQYLQVSLIQIVPTRNLPVLASGHWAASISATGPTIAEYFGDKRSHRLIPKEGWVVDESLAHLDSFSDQTIEVFSNRDNTKLDDLRKIFSALGAIPIVTYGYPGTVLTRMYLSVFDGVIFVSWENGYTVVLKQTKETGNLRIYPTGPLQAETQARLAKRHEILGHTVFVLEPESMYACEWSTRRQPRRQTILFFDESIRKNPGLSQSVGHDEYWVQPRQLAFSRNTTHLTAGYSSFFSHSCSVPYNTLNYSLLEPKTKEPAFFSSTLYFRPTDAGFRPDRIFLDLEKAEQLPEAPSLGSSSSCRSDPAFIAESWFYSFSFWCELEKALEQAHSIPVELSAKLKSALEGAKCECQKIKGSHFTAGEFGDPESLSFLKSFSVPGKDGVSKQSRNKTDQ